MIWSLSHLWLFRLRALVVPGAIVIVILSVTTILRNISIHLIEQDMAEASQAECRRVAVIVQANLRERIAAMQAVADHLSAAASLDEAAFRRFTRSRLEPAPGILAAVVADEGLRPVWMESFGEFDPAALEGALGDSALLQAVEQATRSPDRFAITTPLRFGALFTGFASVNPYARADGASGYVLGIFPAGEVESALLPRDLSLQFTVELHQWNPRTSSPYYSISRPLIPSPSDYLRDLGDAETFPLGSQMWRVTVTPSGYWGNMPAYFTSGTILTLGTLLALVIGALLYRQQWQALHSRDEARRSRTRLASTSDRLARITEELDLILNNVDEGIVLYDENLAPLQANAAFKRTFGLEEGRHGLDADAETHHQGMAARFLAGAQYDRLLHHLRESPERPYVDEIEARGGSSPQGTRYFQRRATAVTGPSGERAGYLVLYQDITHTRTVERLKEDFLSGVTHDLRSPLAAIKGFAETILRNRGMDAATREEFVSIISDETSRLQELIEDLLDLRRLEEGKLDLAPAAYNIRALVDEAVRSSQALLESREIDVNVLWEGSVRGPMFGDAAKIGRAIRNVLANSIKYSPDGSAITILGVEAPQRVEIQFADEGPGIPPEDLPHVFEKFYRGSMHVRRTQGTGLGLAIVRHIVESHGGSVSAGNQPGGGALISITLPRPGPLAGPGETPSAAVVSRQTETTLAAPTRAS